MAPAFEMRGIVKRFPGVTANDRADLTLEAGEIHALLGENGAGKSTLMQILYGLHRMDAGEIRVDGRAVRIRSTADAIRLGIGMVHQEFLLVSRFTVAENVALGLREGKRPWLGLSGVAERLRELSERYGMVVDPGVRVENLPIGVQQRVEILKLLYRDARLLILDEPTAVLTPGEREQLFAALRRLRGEGHTVVIVTHKLSEITALADRVTILRDGRTLATVAAKDVSERELARMMVGREVEFEVKRTAMERGAALGEPLLEARDLRVGDAVRGVSLKVHAGEIVGIAGVDGNGQQELAEALMGLRAAQSGEIRLRVGTTGRNLRGPGLRNKTVAELRAAGVAYIPADRRGTGAVTEMTVSENASLIAPARRQFLRSRSAEESAARGLVERFGIRVSGLDQKAGKLSGGNLQKLILGREMTAGAKVLIVEQPTRGLDAGAVESIWRELLRARAEGKAILLSSAELEELLNLADRIAVIYEGRIVREVEGAGDGNEIAALRTEIGLSMAGAKAEKANG
jgi:general nucleoside transport system ATP-binding protein